MFTMTASGLSLRHPTWVTKVTLVQLVRLAQWVFKELQDRQAHAVRQVHRDYVAKQAQLVYKDLQAQQALLVQLGRKDY